MSRIIELWQDGKLPIKDAIYYADDSCEAVKLSLKRPRLIEKLEEFSLEALLVEDPDFLTSVDITTELRLPGNTGFLCCGEGSHGSEGFFAYLDKYKELRWVCYLEASNPFFEIEFRESCAIFRSTNELAIKVNRLLEAPDTRPTISVWTETAAGSASSR